MMRTSRFLATVVLVTSLGAGALLLAWYRGHGDPKHDAAAVRQTEQLRSELAALAAKVQVLSVRQELPGESAGGTERPDPSTAAAPVAAEPAEPPRLTLEDVLADVPPEEEEQFMRDFERKQVRARKTRTLEQLRSEPRDAAWTREVESLVSTASASIDRNEYPTAHVSSVECGTTLCKIEVDQDNVAEHSAFAGALHTGLRTFGVRRGGPNDPPGEKLGWTLFVTRKGHKMPKVLLEEILALDT